MREQLSRAFTWKNFVGPLPEVFRGLLPERHGQSWAGAQVGEVEGGGGVVGPRNPKPQTPLGIQPRVG